MQSPYFQVKSHSEVLVVRTSTYRFWGDTTQLLTVMLMLHKTFKNTHQREGKYGRLIHEI